MIHNKEIAKQISDLMVKHQGELNESVRLVLDNCSEEEFVKYRRAVGNIMAEMYDEIMGPLYLLHEEIKPDELKPNYIENIKELTKKAEEGDSNAQETLGTFYFKGIYVDKDYDKAFKWLDKTSEKDDHRVQEKLGYMYENGLGTDKDVNKAIELYKASSVKGSSKPSLFLAQYYQNKDDKEEAKYWYKKAIMNALSYKDKDFEEALEYISENE